MNYPVYGPKRSLRYPHEGPQPIQERLAAGQGPLQVRDLQDQGWPSFPADGVYFVPNLPGHPFSDQHQPHPGVSPALGQQLFSVGGSGRGAAGNPGQGKGQQGAGIGNDEKTLVFDGLTPLGRLQVPSVGCQEKI